MPANPVKWIPSVVLGIVPSMTGSVQFRSGGSVQAGTRLPGPDGSRFFYQTAASDVVFILVAPGFGHYHNMGQLFMQTRSGFVSDVELGATAAGVVKRTAATKKVMEGWAELMMGAVTCASGPVGWAVKGFEIAMAGGKFLAHYDAYVDALETLYSRQPWWKQNTPTL